MEKDIMINNSYLIGVLTTFGVVRVDMGGGFIDFPPPKDLRKGKGYE